VTVGLDTGVGVVDATLLRPTRITVANTARMNKVSFFLPLCTFAWHGRDDISSPIEIYVSSRLPQTTREV